MTPTSHSPAFAGDTRQRGLSPHALRARIQRLASIWTARRRKSRELRELYSLTERELSDLGLSRGDFHGVEHGTFRRER